MAPRSTKTSQVRIHRDTFGPAVDHLMVEVKKNRDTTTHVYDNNNSRVTNEKTTLTKVDHPQQNHFQFRTQYSERGLMKNMLTLAISSLFVLTAFVALQNLQSSLYGQSGIGVYTMSLFYAVSALSCLYGPTLIRRICPNWTVILTFVMFAIYISTHFYPAPYVIVPSSVLLALFYGPFLCAQSTFLMLLASKYSSSKGALQDKVIQRFLRLFYFMYNSSQIWGNLISSVILSNGSSKLPSKAHSSHFKSTVCKLDLPLHFSDIGRFNSTIAYSISSTMSLTLISAYLISVLIGVAIVTSLLEKIEMFISQDPKERSHLRITFVRIFSLIFGCKRKSKLRSILPLVFFIGVEQGFMYSDFTKSYVTCKLGIEHVGYVMACLGATSALGTVSIHHFSKHFTRLFALAAVFIFHLGLLFVLWLWKPNSQDVALYYVISTGWGLCSSIWQTLSLTLVSKFCQEEDWESSFATYFLVQLLGLSTSFGFSRLLANNVKVFILTGLLIVSCVPYTIVEVVYYKDMMSSQTIATV